MPCTYEMTSWDYDNIEAALLTKILKEIGSSKICKANQKSMKECTVELCDFFKNHGYSKYSYEAQKWFLNHLILDEKRNKEKESL